MDFRPIILSILLNAVTQLQRDKIKPASNEEVRRVKPGHRFPLIEPYITDWPTFPYGSPDGMTRAGAAVVRGRMRARDTPVELPQSVTTNTDTLIESVGYEAEHRALEVERCHELIPTHIVPRLSGNMSKETLADRVERLVAITQNQRASLEQS